MLLCGCCLPADRVEAAETLFSYGDLDGPAHWGGTCRVGRRQSPINLPGFRPSSSSSSGGPAGACVGAAGAQLQFNYPEQQRVTILNTGVGTMQVNVPPGSTLSVGGTAALQLLQFHFHAPSEHAVGGRRAAMEAHLVHRRLGGPGNRLAVVAVLLEADDNAASAALNPLPQSLDPKPSPARCAALLRAVLDSAPVAARQEVAGGAPISPGWLLPPGDGVDGVRHYVHYAGSLTTPPCSEGVDWFVLTRPVAVSSSQVLEFMHYVGQGASYKSNARPLQPSNNRPLDFDCLRGALA